MPMRAPRCWGSAAIVSRVSDDGLEQQVVDHGLVLIGDLRDLVWHGEHDVEVRHRQQLGLALGEPLLRRRALTLWTMPVAAGVVGDESMRALLATQHMPAERRRATALDR